MNQQLEIINPLTFPQWDELALSAREYSFFHSSSWAKVLAESYNYNPRYFVAHKNNQLTVLLPIMEIKSFLTPKRGVSLPFSDYCQPIIPVQSQFRDVLNDIINFGKRAGWKFVEIKGGEDLLRDFPHSSYYYLHTLEPLQNEERVFSGLRDSTRRNISKSMKKGVKIKICNSLESVKVFFRLNCLTRKLHGYPPQPFCFFKNIYKYVISKNSGIVSLASYNGEVIAGGIYFHFGKKAIYKYGASDKKFQHLRANNLVMWEAIKWYCHKNYLSFSFGRTEPENYGLRQFKNGWGTTESIIQYYKYDIKNRAFVNDNGHVSGFVKQVFHIMPVPLLKIVGSLCYKHIG